MPPESLTALLKAEAGRLGFALVGACPAVTAPRIHRFFEWLAAGYAGQMTYLADRAEAYRDPRSVMDSVRSILMLGLPYRTAEPAAVLPGAGRISRYAWGADYHDVVRNRLGELAEFHRGLTPGVRLRGVVDTAPLLEREYAQLAGLGWIGKNTLLLNRRWGSWFFLAALLTSEVLAYDAPAEYDHCGTCRACLDACPTGALLAPYQLDARRCISYLSIELRQQIPRPLRSGLGDWLFGCDACQEVCPWNRHSRELGDSAFAPQPENNPAKLGGLFSLDDAAFRQRFRTTPLWRAKRRGLLRNAAILLGNRPFPAAFSGLLRGLVDSEPLVRAACVWALGRYGAPQSGAALRARLADESDPAVREEIDSALQDS